MSYDLLIKNGTVIDGSGMPRVRADVGIVNGKIAAIGKIRESAKEVLDAEGHVAALARRRPYPHGRASILGSSWHLLVLARHYQRGDGQLRIFSGALLREEQAYGDA
jgi:hypothetical protein